MTIEIAANMETTPELDYSLLMEDLPENGTQRAMSVYELYGYFNVVIVSTIFCVIAFLGLTGNTMVFIAVGLSRKLHNITNAFIVNLSICDFLSCTILPFHAVAVIAADGWPLADWFCSFIASLSIITQTSGILNLTMISLNRYVLITKPRKLYMRVYTHNKVAWMIAFTWLFPFLFLLVPQFFLGGLGLPGLLQDLHLELTPQAGSHLPGYRCPRFRHLHHPHHLLLCLHLPFHPKAHAHDGQQGRWQRPCSIGRDRRGGKRPQR